MTSTPASQQTTPRAQSDALPRRGTPIEKAVSRILPIEGLAQEVARFQSQGLKVGLCHGCFDLLHAGHLRHFEAARQDCDALIVSVTPDPFINKGPGRPIYTDRKRAELIAGLAVVSYCCINRWESAVELLPLLKPDVYFKGQEYQHNAAQVNANFLAEQSAAKKAGIDVAFTYEEVLSSSETLKQFQAIDENQVRQ